MPSPVCTKSWRTPRSHTKTSFWVSPLASSSSRPISSGHHGVETLIELRRLIPCFVAHRLRQIPHLKLKEPPASLAGYLTDPTQDPQAGTDGKAPSNGSASSPQEGFKASQAYALDKLKFSLFANAIDELETFLHASAVLAPLLGVRLRDGQAWSGYAWLWGAAGRLTEEWVQRTPHWLNWGRGEIPTSLSFIVLSSALELVTSIPADLYKQFVLEEKHGFNKQTLGLFIADQVRLSWFFQPAMDF